MHDRIKNKKDYKLFLQADLSARGHQKLSVFSKYKTPITHYQCRLRRLEFFLNYRHSPVLMLYCRYLSFRYKQDSVRLGFQVPPYTCGPGLVLVHWGSIIISAKSRIGSHCRIHSCVNIGAGGKGAPVIGDNVYIGPGAKIFGDIEIGNNVVIGANAVVNKTFPENVIIAGVPAVIISDNSSE